MMQLVFVYPSRRIRVVPLPNVWIHVAAGLGMALQALTIVLPPLRALLGLVPVSSAIFAAIMVAVLLTSAVAEFLGRRHSVSPRVKVSQTPACAIVGQLLVMPGESQAGTGLDFQRSGVDDSHRLPTKHWK